MLGPGLEPGREEILRLNFRFSLRNLTGTRLTLLSPLVYTVRYGGVTAIPIIGGIGGETTPYFA